MVNAPIQGPADGLKASHRFFRNSTTISGKSLLTVFGLTLVDVEWDISEELKAAAYKNLLRASTRPKSQRSSTLATGAA
jgi:hypothetical protein